GDAYFYGLSDEQLKVQPVQHILRLGYWRKHPDLHGYIVQNFANGEDRCQQISLEIDDIRQIINAIRNDELPFTEGFFFGESENDDEQKNNTIVVFENALKWVQTDDGRTWRSVYYQASW